MPAGAVEPPDDTTTTTLDENVDPAVPDETDSEVAIDEDAVGADPSPVGDVPITETPADLSMPVLEEPPTVELPPAGEAIVSVGATPEATRAVSGPSVVTVSAPAKAAGSVGLSVPASVKVRTMSQAGARSVGARGLLFQVQLADGQASSRVGTVDLEVDYSKFRYLYGGDFAQRMVLTQYPSCAVTRPQRRVCQKGTPVKFVNDLKAGTLRATVVLTEPPTSGTGTQSTVPVTRGRFASRMAGGRLTVRPTAGGGGSSSGVFGITTGPGGQGGTFSATPLAASGSWSVGQPSGSFSWSYPIEVPKATVGPAPSLSLGYSSQSVDGFTAAENTQAGPAGLGWDLSGLGSIDRRYMSCMDSRQGQGWADQCWYYDNATITLNGRSSELVKEVEAFGLSRWHLKDDPDWRITKSLTTNNNGDNDGEYWTVETPDGTTYYFGIGRQKDTTNQTDSVFTMPVFGNNTDEPCHQTGNVSASWCQQAWRWNLDRIVDASGNTTTIFYDQETNAYLMRGGAEPTTYATYVRAGQPLRIEYSQGPNSVPSTPPTKVEFDYADRCIAGLDNVTACPATIPANAAQYPDVPVDLFCILTCSGWDHLSPTFFTTKRLRAIRTYTQDSNGSRTVDRYMFTHGYPTQDAGDVGSKLWLFTIARTGDPQGQNTTLPSVIFYGAQLQNRADTGSGVPPTKLYRISTIRNEIGGDTRVTYKQQKPCNTGSGIPDDWLPSASGWDTNNYDCFVAYFDPAGPPVFGPSINNKWLVDQVTLDDLVAGSPNAVYDYTYADTKTVTARWHHSDDPFEKDDHDTWSQWRGYSKITVVNSTTKTESRYFLGMDGDLNNNGSHKSVTVKQQSNATRPDNDELYGRVFETRSLSGSTEKARTTKYFWLSPTTATMSRPQFASVSSRYIRDEQVDTLTTGTSQMATSKYMIYDSAGYLVVSRDLGNALDSTDDRCERFAYTRSSDPADPWIRDRVYRVTLRNGANYNSTNPTDSCSSNSEIRKTETYYDNHTSLTAVPEKGRPTRVKQYADASNSINTYSEYDSYGRLTSVTDADGNETTTAYSPAGNALTDTITVTPPRSVLKTTTELTDFRMAPKVVTTPQGDTKYTYDGLGRVTDVFLPGDPANNATYLFTYTISPTYSAPARIRSQVSRSTPGSGTYVSSFKFLDGFGRERETQTDSPNAGKIVSATKYDARGLAQYVSQPYWASGASGTLNNAGNGAIDTYVKLAYDALSRQTSATTMSKGATVTRVDGATTIPMTTTTAYDGLKTTVTSPEGRIKESIADARGQTVETIDHGTSTLVHTTMQYSKRGELTQVTDEPGNITTMSYDWLGRRASLDDPDMGASTYQYTDTGLLQLATDSDPAAANVYTVYDNMGRPTERRKNSATGALLAEWAYYDDDNHTTINDGVKEGRLETATTYDDTDGDTVTDAYVKTANDYDNRGNPTQVTYTIPAAAGFSTTPTNYIYNTTYDNGGNVVNFTYPGLGGLATETTTSTYNAVGLPERLTAGATVYVDDTAWRSDGKLDGRTLGVAGSGHYATRSYGYSAQTQRLKVISASLDGSTTNFQHDAYSYDLDGNVTAITDQTNSQTQCFTYSGLARLDHAWTTDLADCSDGDAWPNTNIGFGPNGYRLGYDYDEVGNITTRYDGGANTTYNYDYADPNHPHAVTCVKPQSTACANHKRYTYDANGQMDKRSQGASDTTLTWDDQHRLRTVTTPTGIQQNVYDADGQRILRIDEVTGGATTRTLYLPNQELAKVDTAVPTATRYYMLGGVSVALKTSGGQVHFLLGNHQGSASFTVEKAAGTIAQRRYLPFGGERTGNTSTLPTQRGFVGQTEDQSTDLNYLNARYYDAVIGRFISVDPIATAGSQSGSAYAYSGNSPITASDPSGLLPENADWSCLIAPDPIACANGKTADSSNDSTSDSDASSSATMESVPAAEIPVVPNWGVVRINLFIKSAQAGFGPSRSLGDNRDFSEDALCSESRLCLRLDFRAGRASGRINFSCSVDGECSSPSKENRVSIASEGTSVRISISAVNPRAPKLPLLGRSPAIDMRISVGRQRMTTRARQFGLFVEERNEIVPFGVQVDGDAYPSVEVYQDRGTVTDTLILRSETNILRLADLFPDKHSQYPEVNAPETA